MFAFAVPSTFAESGSIGSEEIKVVRAILVENGVKKKLSATEYEVLMEQNNHKVQEIERQKNINQAKLNKNDGVANELKPDEITPFALIDMSIYTEAGFIQSVYRNDLTRRISVPVYNETSQEVTRTISFTASQSYTSNVSLTSTYAKNAFTAGVTVGSSWSNTYSDSDSVTQKIPPHKYSWMEYTPNMSNSYGTMHEEVWNFDGFTNVKIVDKTYFLDVYIAKPGNAGLPDGLYTVKESSTKPN
ncbi:hypothetical protein P9H28_21765 [Paenibacillus barengoltzii]|uniref:hypothetical protein n=1 Tax=Paenibacillus barengoltzii TaxID=343517 RepID=UPI002DBAB21A|nr:hypothetical protein [Paenibacillus barengoltzii]MEC2346705.1 hypothetical protein [Paenibacillus barengoltzii]